MQILSNIQSDNFPWESSNPPQPAQGLLAGFVYCGGLGVSLLYCSHIPTHLHPIY